LISLPRPNRPGIVLDGPVLGSLPTETKESLQEINARSQERLQEYLEARMQEGKSADPAELTKLRQQTRDELTKLLAPNELEEYLLRYSQNAAELRADFGQLRYFNASPDEFRAVFRATDAIDQRIQSVSGTDLNSLQARKALEDERENAIKLALGPKRYEEYRNLQDPVYRGAVAQAEQAGAPGTAQLIYQVNLAALAEQASLSTNASLTASQKALAQKQAELEQMTANALATGQEVMPEGPPPVPSTPPRRTYVMRPGDNVAVVSLIYGVPVSAIRQANPNVNFRRLKPGDVLQIPPATQLPLGMP
jgi:LysM repeat protein